MKRLAAIAVVLLLVTPVAAQSARPGMRLTVTRVAPSGGFTANGFLVVHATTITRTAAPECGAGLVRLDARGQDTRGRVRSAHLVTIAGESDRATDVGTGGCSASIEVVLEDGSHVAITRGSVRGRLVGGSGLDATIDGSAIDGGGVPTTVTGHIVLSPAS